MSFVKGMMRNSSNIFHNYRKKNKMLFFVIDCKEIYGQTNGKMACTYNLDVLSEQ